MKHKGCGGTIRVVEKIYRDSKLIEVLEDGRFLINTHDGVNEEVDDAWLLCEKCQLEGPDPDQLTADDCMQGS